jgi:hypothetical protein
VEFGRDGDLSADGVAGRKLFDSRDDVVAAHKWLLANTARIVPAKACAVPELDWRYRVMPEGGPPVALLSRNVNNDLFEIGKGVQRWLNQNGRLRPAHGPEHLKIFGACTLVLHPDDTQKDVLHEPWATSGFVLAPVVQGFDMIYFRRY